MNNVIKKYWLILILAVAVSFIYGSHYFFISNILSSQDEVYYPVTVSNNFDEGMYYGPRAQAFYLGDFWPGDINLIEYRDSPAMLPFLSPFMLGNLGKVVGSLKDAFILSDFIFPFLIFISLYILMFGISNRRSFSIFFASIFIFIPKIFLTIPPISPSLFREFLHNILPSSDNALYFIRFEYPQTTFLFFVLAFYFLFKALREGGGAMSIYAGISFGVLFYSYLYDWAYFLTSLFIMILFFFLQKDYDRVRVIFTIIGIGLIFSIFYWINFINLHSLDYYQDLVSRLGVEISNNMRLVSTWKTYLRSVILVFLTWIAWGKKDKVLSNYLIGFLLSIIMVLNIQVITGFNPQPDHWHKIQFLIIGLSISLLILWLYEKYIHIISSKILRITASLFIIYLFGSALYGQYDFSKKSADQYILSSAYAESYDWLNKNTNKYSVVGSISVKNNNELILHTHNKIFLASGLNSLAPTEELWERSMTISAIFELSSGDFINFISSNNFYLFTDKYRDNSFDSYFISLNRVIPNEIINIKINEYENLSNEFLIENIPYNLDYIYVSPRDGEFNISNDLISSWEKVYENNDIIIYKL